MDDRMLEVVGLGGPTHEALVRLYLTSGMRIAQGRHVEIAIQKPGVSVAMAVRLTNYQEEDVFFFFFLIGYFSS